MTRRFLARLGLLIATVAVLLGAFELGLRAFWGGFYLKGDRTYLTSNATRGWANRPSTTAVYGEAEYHVTVSNNALGFRGKEVAPAKPPGSARVLVLGDSFTYGIGVADDETFSARLAALDPRADVLNTGVNGYGTAQELLLLRDQGLALRPDVVVVAFFWNDVGNSFSRSFPRFVLEDGTLRWPEPLASAPPQVAAPRRPWLRYSHAYRFLSDRLKLASFRIKLLLGLPLETTDFVNESDRDAAWQLSAELLRAIRDQAGSVGARTVLAIIPDQVQVEEGVTVVGLDPADYEVQPRMRQVCERLGIPVIDLLPPLREAYATDGQALYYPKDRHLNARAHAVVARALRAELAGLDLLPPVER